MSDHVRGTSHDDQDRDARNRRAATGASRRSHVPGDGSAHAAAVERAQKGMLHEARDLKRTRIGADVLCEALLRQGVESSSAIRAA